MRADFSQLDKTDVATMIRLSKPITVHTAKAGGGQPGGIDFMARRALRLAAGANANLSGLNDGFAEMDHPDPPVLTLPKQFPSTPPSRDYTIALGFGGSTTLPFVTTAAGEGGVYWSPGNEWGFFESVGFGLVTNAGFSFNSTIYVVFGDQTVFGGLGAALGVDVSFSVYGGATGMLLFTVSPFAIAGFAIAGSVGVSFKKWDIFLEVGPTGTQSLKNISYR